MTCNKVACGRKQNYPFKLKGGKGGRGSEGGRGGGRDRKEGEIEERRGGKKRGLTRLHLSGVRHHGHLLHL